MTDRSFDVLASELTSDARRYVRLLQRAELHSDEPRTDIGPLIGAIRAELAAIERDYTRATSPHQHDWSDDDYCSICGLDGRS